MTAGGQPAHEVQGEVRQVAAALGYRRVQVSTGPTGIIVCLGDGTPATFESVEGGLRLDQATQVYEIRTALERGSMSVAEATERLSSLRRVPHRYPRGGLDGGVFVIACGIALILQPAWSSVLFAGLASPIVGASIRIAARGRLLATLMPFGAALIVALAAFWAHSQGWIVGPLRTMLPPIAILLPGALIVTGLSEVAAGAMVAGTARLSYGTSQLVMFGLGVAGAAILLRVPPEALANTTVDSIGWWSPIAGLVLVASGISLTESVPMPLVPWILLILGLTLSAQIGGQHVAPWFGALLGAGVASAGSGLVELARPQLPRMVMFLPSFWLLVPGSLGLVSVAQLGLEPSIAAPTITQSVSIVCAIALGMLLGTSVSRTVAIIVERGRALRRRRIRLSRKLV